MAYAQQFVPGTESDQNEWFASKAIEGFERVLEKDPRNIEAVQWLASIYQDSQQHTKAREYFLMLIGLNPSDPTAFYMVGVVNWVILSNEGSRLSIEDRERLIAEGLKNLDSALAIDREFDEAVAYKDLFLRQRAEFAMAQGGKSNPQRLGKP
jgi:tetratricopeptide (TPR) repeat protein